MRINKQHLMSRTADVLEWWAKKGINFIAFGVELVLIDHAHGKARFRKHSPRPRLIVQKTIVVRNAAPRVVVVKERDLQTVSYRRKTALASR